MASDIEAFERLGYRPLERRSPYEVTLRAPGGAPDLLLRLHREGRFFGGNWALEVSTADPVLPPSHGLSARGRGMVRMRGVRFRGDDRLARRSAPTKGSGRRSRACISSASPSSRRGAR